MTSVQSSPAVLSTGNARSDPPTAHEERAKTTIDLTAIDLEPGEITEQVGTTHAEAGEIVEQTDSSNETDEDEETNSEMSFTQQPAARAGDNGAGVQSSAPLASRIAPIEVTLEDVPAFLARIAFIPGQSFASEYNAEDHKVMRRDMDRLAIATAHLDQLVDKVSKELDSKVTGLTADIAEAAYPNPTPDRSVISSLITASNVHSDNNSRMGFVLREILLRIRKLEETTAGFTGLQATVESHHQALKVVLKRASANTGTAPPIISDDDAARIEQATNGNRKRPHPEADDGQTSKRRSTSGVLLPPLFTYPGAPATADAVTTYVSPMRDESTRALAVREGGLPNGTYRAAQDPTQSLPPPYTAFEDARQVLLGPLEWRWHNDPRAVVNMALGPRNASLAHFLLGESQDKDTAVLVFETAREAAWFVGTWNSGKRPGYEQVYSSSVTIRRALNRECREPDVRDQPNLWKIVHEKTHFPTDQPCLSTSSLDPSFLWLRPRGPSDVKGRVICTPSGECSVDDREHVQFANDDVCWSSTSEQKEDSRNRLETQGRAGEKRARANTDHRAQDRHAPFPSKGGFRSRDLAKKIKDPTRPSTVHVRTWAEAGGFDAPDKGFRATGARQACAVPSENRLQIT
ncbi:hypothetical protein DFH06DRAFT_1127584 [Mycena polygramma]|nr:hypothetical protein DFH06DRAFT_1127584 [Mycena polygramma]